MHRYTELQGEIAPIIEHLLLTGLVYFMTLSAYSCYYTQRLQVCSSHCEHAINCKTIEILRKQLAQKFNHIWLLARNSPIHGIAPYILALIRSEGYVIRHPACNLSLLTVTRLVLSRFRLLILEPRLSYPLSKGAGPGARVHILYRYTMKVLCTCRGLVQAGLFSRASCRHRLRMKLRVGFFYSTSVREPGNSQQ